MSVPYLKVDGVEVEFDWNHEKRFLDTGFHPALWDVCL